MVVVAAVVVAVVVAVAALEPPTETKTASCVSNSFQEFLLSYDISLFSFLQNKETKKKN